MNHYVEAFEKFAKEHGTGPVQDLRARGLARFRELGFPTTKQEAWRFTNVAPLAKSAFALGRPSTNGVAPEAVAKLGFGNSLVFVDGHYRPDLSQAPAGVSLASVLDRFEIVTSDDAPAFVELNTAFLEDGAFVEVDGEIEDPIHVLFIGTDGKVCHPRNVYHVKRHASAHVVETYVSLGEAAHWTNTVGMAIVEENGRLEHTRLQLENEAAYHTSNVWVRQRRDSRYTSNVATLGGRLTRNDITASLEDENCLATLNGLIITRGEQHVDNSTKIEHRMPHCESHELYKSILDDKSSGVFTGYIHVFEDAQKTDAFQASSALLLSDEATMDSQPQLEIYADDVKCSHGSTVGQLDDNALFYLRARGLPKKEARNMLIRAFVHDVSDRMEVEPVRARVDELMEERLPR
jgi:Fe-S cluster assembly protein SufD